jgi:hypothetical protein
MKTTAVIVVLALFSGPATGLAQDNWEFRLSPYAWLAGIKGDVSTIPGLPVVPIEVSASDALSDLEGGGMLRLDANKGRHGFAVDLIYTDVQSDEELLPDPINLKLKSISKNTLVTASYQYELYSQGQTLVRVLAGLRYWDVDSELTFTGGLGALAGVNIRNSESWVDPGLGMIGRMPLGGSRFYMIGGFGLGGFGVGSDLFYEFNANIGYQWTESIGTSVGYRLFDVDYENKDFVYDVRQQGWQLGLTWSF